MQQLRMLLLVTCDCAVSNISFCLLGPFRIGSILHIICYFIFQYWIQKKRYMLPSYQRPGHGGPCVHIYNKYSIVFINKIWLCCCYCPGKLWYSAEKIPVERLFSYWLILCYKSDSLWWQSLQVKRMKLFPLIGWRHL